MQVTNKFGFPSALVQAVLKDDYNRGDADITCTELIAPPRQIALRSKFREEITEDVSEVLYRLWGQAIHTILERASMDSFVEKRLTAKCNGWKISGKVDLIIEKDRTTIVDWKSPSVFNVREGHKDEWIWQLQVLRWLAEQNGIHIDALENDVLFRDFRPSEARRYDWYPTRAMRMPVEPWDLEQAKDWMVDRVKLHQDSRNNLPNCSMDETWKGRRCAGYCNVFFVCSQANPTPNRKGG